jgi:hypothetical protein
MLALGSVGLVLSKAVNAGSMRWACLFPALAFFSVAIVSLVKAAGEPD